MEVRLSSLWYSISIKLTFQRSGKAENASFLGSWAFQHGEVGLRYFLLCSAQLTLNRAMHLADLITEMNGKRYMHY